ncbi:MAG: response regulator transcription factor [Clostridiales Family XIII bacterium]|jgi:DNA-binding response OmpR family regulator|nr:response regulator transcription factor [Clostridiales Family XIII bacterium]
MNILIVEDERFLAEALAQIMKNQRYMVDLVYDGIDGLDYAMSGRYDAVILDIMLPRMDGFAVVKKLREAKNATPVLLLTAKEEVADKVKGLDCGADDYLTKPFSQEELSARIRALTRRRGEVILDVQSFADLSLQLSAGSLHCGEKSVRVSFKESEILKILMSNPERITTKEMLINKVWGSDSNAEDNTVEAHISFLRKKFFYLNTRVTIETTRKMGYRLEEKKRDP